MLSIAHPRPLAHSTTPALSSAPYSAGPVCRHQRVCAHVSLHSGRPRPPFHRVHPLSVPSRFFSSRVRARISRRHPWSSSSSRHRPRPASSPRVTPIPPPQGPSPRPTHVHAACPARPVPPPRRRQPTTRTQTLPPARPTDPTDGPLGGWVKGRAVGAIVPFGRHPRRTGAPQRIPRWVLRGRGLRPLPPRRPARGAGRSGGPAVATA